VLRSRWPQSVRLFHQTGSRKFIAFLYSVSVLLGAFWLLFAASGPTYAAVELSAFDVVVTPNEVVVEWQTVSETDIFGFEIWFKEETASQSAYRLVDKRIAQGALERGVLYRMNVTYLLKRNTAYCFQLRELPINGERGEILVRCGYGLGISAQPTPTPTSFFTPTTQILTSTTDLTPTLPLTLTGAVTMTGQLTNTTPDGIWPTMTPTPPVPDALATDSIWPVFSPTPALGDPGQSLLLTPPVAPQGIEQPPLPDGPSPLATPLPNLTTPDPGAIATAGVDSAALYAPVDPLSQMTVITTTNGGPMGGAPVAAVPQLDPAVAPAPAYIVLTATPTSEMVASLPTFTPYPTEMPASAINLVGLRVPDTQNLMIMLLCGVFSGASGLGVLGLVSTLLYMRARRQNQTPQRRG